MKFCYIDESADGAGCTVVAVGVVVDGSRMHMTKADWTQRLREMSKAVGRDLHEFKASELYGGAGPWRRLDGQRRSEEISRVVDWLANRKHNIVFSGSTQDLFAQCHRPEITDLRDIQCAADLHMLLALQRRHQRLGRTKGQTVVVMDQGRHQDEVVRLVRDPRPWTDAYYGRPKNAPAFDCIVDVPYFVDSKHAVLIQTADLFAYVLRRFVELEDLDSREKYIGERGMVREWAGRLKERSLFADQWPTNQITDAHRVFRAIAPPSLQRH